MTTETKLDLFIKDVMGDVKKESIDELKDFFINTDIENLSALYWIRKLHIDQPYYNVVELFRALMAKEVRHVQQFTEAGARRRVYSHISNSEISDEKEVSLYVKSANGEEEEWIPTATVINQGRWVSIPRTDQHVGYGIALEALQAGFCDYIRCEDWADQTLYLEIDKRTDPAMEQRLVTLNSQTIFTPSMTSMFSRKWIMINLK